MGFRRVFAEHRAQFVVGVLASLAAAAILALLALGGSDDDRTIRDAVYTGPADDESGNAETAADDRDSEGGEPAPKPPPERVRRVTLDELSDEGKVLTSSAADVREILVGGVSDPAGGYMYIGQAYPNATITLVANRQYDYVEGQVGKLADAECPQNDARIAVKDGREGDGGEIWSGAASDDARRFRLNIRGLDRVVLYGRATSSSGPTCRPAQVGWANVVLVDEPT